MHFHADDDFPFAGAAFDQFRFFGGTSHVVMLVGGRKAGGKTAKPSAR
jgi:hypothetical protein